MSTLGELVLVPSLPHVSDAALKAFEKTQAVLLYGPRTGSKTRNFAIPEGLAPGPLRELLRIRITQVSSLRPGVFDVVKGKASGKAERWREYLETESEVLARFSNSDPALVAAKNHHYLACWADEKLLHATVLLLCKKAKLKTQKLPPHIRLRKRGNLVFAFNYGTKNWPLPAKAKLLLGNKVLAPQSVAAWKDHF